MRRVNKLYLWVYAFMPPKVFDHDLEEPDDLFTDIHNFAVFAIF
jgi:hypothetical protein